MPLCRGDDTATRRHGDTAMKTPHRWPFPAYPCRRVSARCGLGSPPGLRKKTPRRFTAPGSLSGSRVAPRETLDIYGVLRYHAASAQLPCCRLRCRTTRPSDRSALSIPPLTAHMANNGGKRPYGAALYRLRLSLLSIRRTRRRQAVKASTIRRLAA